MTCICGHYEFDHDEDDFCEWLECDCLGCEEDPEDEDR
jgi:hypothetical protein